jgi:hypothetical protein
MDGESCGGAGAKIIQNGELPTSHSRKGNSRNMQVTY